MIFKILANYGPLLLAAMGQTLLLALWSLFFACLIGLFVGILSVLKSRVCNIIATIFVDIIRGVPMIVLAFFVYFGVPMLTIIAPAARAVRRCGAKRVGLIATEFTVASGSYERQIHALCPETEVIAAGSPNLAGLIDRGETDGEAVDVDPQLRGEMGDGAGVAAGQQLAAQYALIRNLLH